MRRLLLLLATAAVPVACGGGERLSAARHGIAEMERLLDDEEHALGGCAPPPSEEAAVRRWLDLQVQAIAFVHAHREQLAELVGPNGPKDFEHAPLVRESDRIGNRISAAARAVDAAKCREQFSG